MSLLWRCQPAHQLLLPAVKHMQGRTKKHCGQPSSMYCSPSLWRRDTQLTTHAVWWMLVQQPKHLQRSTKLAAKRNDLAIQVTASVCTTRGPGSFRVSTLLAIEVKKKNSCPPAVRISKVLEREQIDTLVSLPPNRDLTAPDTVFITPALSVACVPLPGTAACLACCAETSSICMLCWSSMLSARSEALTDDCSSSGSAHSRLPLRSEHELTHDHCTGAFISSMRFTMHAVTYS